jgi:hypothetical protein
MPPAEFKCNIGVLICRNCMRCAITPLLFFLILRGGVHTGSTRHCGHYWPIVHAPGDCDGEVGGMNGFGRGNRSTRRKPALPGREPGAAAVGSQRLTASAMARPRPALSQPLYQLRYPGCKFVVILFYLWLKGIVWQVYVLRVYFVWRTCNTCEHLIMWFQRQYYSSKNFNILGQGLKRDYTERSGWRRAKLHFKEFWNYSMWQLFVAVIISEIERKMRGMLLVRPSKWH